MEYTVEAPEVSTEEESPIPPFTDFAKQRIKDYFDILKQAGTHSAASAIGLPRSINDLVTAGKEYLGEKGVFIPPVPQSTSTQFINPTQRGGLFDMLSEAPSSEDVLRHIGSDAEGFTQKVAARGGDIFGPAVLTGFGFAPALLSSIFGGLAGQTAEEAGLGPIGQMIAEVVGGGVGTLKQGPSKVASKIPETQRTLEGLEKLGVSEPSKLVARHGLEENTRLAKAAGPSIANKESVAKASEEVSKTIQTYLKEKIPDLEKGRDYLKDAHREVFSALENIAESVPISDTEQHVNELNRMIKASKRVTDISPERAAVIKSLENQRANVSIGINAAGEPLTAADLLRMYRENNSTYGSWINKHVKRNAMRDMQNNIIETIAEQGPEGKRTAELIRDTNKYHQKFIKTQEVLDNFDSFVNTEGLVNFKKVGTFLDNVDNRTLVSEILGPESVKDLTRIKNASEHIDKLEKALGNPDVQNYLKKGALTGVAGAIFGVLTGGTSLATAGLGAAAVASPYVVGKLTQRLSSKMLTDPSYQRMTANFLESLMKGSAVQTASWANKIKEALENDPEDTGPDDAFTVTPPAP